MLCELKSHFKTIQIKWKNIIYLRFNDDKFHVCVGLHAQGDLGDPGLDVEGHGDLQPVVLHHDHVPQPVTQPRVKLEHSFADYPSSASKTSIQRFVIMEKAH